VDFLNPEEYSNAPSLRTNGDYDATSDYGGNDGKTEHHKTSTSPPSIEWIAAVNAAASTYEP
jgi:hypothetical protein